MTRFPSRAGAPTRSSALYSYQVALPSESNVASSSQRNTCSGFAGSATRRQRSSARSSSYVARCDRAPMDVAGRGVRAPLDARERAFDARPIRIDAIVAIGRCPRSPSTGRARRRRVETNLNPQRPNNAARPCPCGAKSRAALVTSQRRRRSALFPSRSRARARGRRRGTARAEAGCDTSRFPSVRRRETSRRVRATRRRIWQPQRRRSRRSNRCPRILRRQIRTLLHHARARRCTSPRARQSRTRSNRARCCITRQLVGACIATRLGELFEMLAATTRCTRQPARRPGDGAGSRHALSCWWAETDTSCKAASCGCTSSARRQRPGHARLERLRARGPTARRGFAWSRQSAHRVFRGSADRTESRSSASAIAARSSSASTRRASSSTCASRKRTSERRRCRALTALLMGMRASEVTDRVVRDLDDEGRLLWIEVGKTKRSRTLEVPALLPPYLLALAKDRGPEEQLITRGRHSVATSAGRQWLRYWVTYVCHQAEIPRICVHSRGLHATLATEAGVSSHAVASALGHTSPAVTHAHYVHRERGNACRPGAWPRSSASRYPLARCIQCVAFRKRIGRDPFPGDEKGFRRFCKERKP